MLEIERHRLITHWRKIKTQLKYFPDVLDHLIENLVLTPDQCRDILKRQKTQQLDKFLEYLTDSPNVMAFTHFMKALHSEGYKHLAREIEGPIQVKDKKEVERPNTTPIQITSDVLNRLEKLENNATEDRQNFNRILLETNEQVLDLRKQMTDDHDKLLLLEQDLEEKNRDIFDKKLSFETLRLEKQKALDTVKDQQSYITKLEKQIKELKGKIEIDSENSISQEKEMDKKIEEMRKYFKNEMQIKDKKMEEEIARYRRELDLKNNLVARQQKMLLDQYDIMRTSIHGLHLEMTEKMSSQRFNEQ